MLYFYVICYYIGARGIMPLEIIIFNDNDPAIQTVARRPPSAAEYFWDEAFGVRQLALNLIHILLIADKNNRWVGVSAPTPCEK